MNLPKPASAARACRYGKNGYFGICSCPACRAGEAKVARRNKTKAQVIPLLKKVAEIDTAQSAEHAANLGVQAAIEARRLLRLLGNLP